MTNTIDDQLAAARADFQRLQALQDRIDVAGAEARSTATLVHYRHAATERAREYREHRDELKNKLDRIAMADKLDLNALFTAYVEVRDADARAGALNVHSSMLNTLEPPERNHIGVQPMPHGAQVAELYKGLAFTAFLDHILAQRADRIRAQHRAELEAHAHKEIRAAEQAARDHAAAAVCATRTRSAPKQGRAGVTTTFIPALSFSPTLYRACKPRLLDDRSDR
jgi:hypothetical protein